MNKLHGGVILAGGKGKRLFPLTSKLPKPLLPVDGKSPLERCVHALEAAGISSIAITTGYLGDETEKRFSEKEIERSRSDNKNISFYREETPMGTAGMVFQILPELDETFFVLSGDIIFDFSLREMLEFHKSKKAHVTIASVKSDNPIEYGTLIIKNGIVTAFNEKPSWKQLISTKINAGIYIIDRKVMEEYGSGITDFASELFPLLLSEKKTIACFETDGYWCDMGTAESYLRCNMYLSKGKNIIGDYISISNKSEISQSVIMNGVKVGKGSVITSSVIGEGVSIGNNCRIENAVIGHYSLICDNVMVKKGGIVPCDSIIGRNKTIESNLSPKGIFSDSGKIIFTSENDSKMQIVSKALAEISEGMPIILFYQKGERSQILYNIFSESLISSGAKIISGGESFLPIASFSSSTQNCFSVFCAYSENDNFHLYIIDKFGLPLSREDQINLEKASADPIFGKVKTSIGSIHDFNTDYINSKCNKELNVSSVAISTNNQLLQKMINKHGGKCEFLQKGSTTKNDCFIVNELGNDLFCITNEGKKVDKPSLISMFFSYYPPKNTCLPEHTPEFIKEIISKNGGNFFLYNDSKANRRHTEDFCNYDDPFSVALGVVFCCANENKTVSQLLSQTSQFVFAEKVITFNGNKAHAIDSLFENYYSRNENQLKKHSEKGYTSIIPQYKNAFRIFAEATSAEIAQELISLAESDIAALDNKPN